MSQGQALLALAVQHLLAEKGMTQAEFAAAIGAKPSDLSRRLSGDVPFEDRDVARLAAGLGVTPDELICRASDLGWKATQAAVQARVREMRHDGN